MLPSMVPRMLCHAGNPAASLKGIAFQYIRAVQLQCHCMAALPSMVLNAVTVKSKEQNQLDVCDWPC